MAGAVRARARATVTTACLRRCFIADSYWRDVLALTWRIQTVGGADAIVRELDAARRAAGRAASRSIRSRTPPRRVTRAGTEAIEAIFRFETAEGRGSGVVRLIARRRGRHAEGLDAAHRARRDEGPRGAASARSRPDRAGLLARFPRAQLARPAARPPPHMPTAIRPCWSSAAGRPGCRSPRAWPAAGRHADRRPRAAHRRQLAQALPRADPAQPGARQSPALHAVSAELADLHPEGQARRTGSRPMWRAWSSTTGPAPNSRAAPTTKRRALVGRAAPRRRHDARTMHPRHVVMATGVSGIPNLPDIPTLRNFAGTVLHSSQYEDGEAWSGKRALVIGTGNSGHDIAQDLHVERREVTLVQRSPTLVVNIEPSAQLAYALYDEGPAAGGLRPDRRVDAARARAQEPRPAHRAGESSSTRTCSTSSSASGSSSISARTAPAGSSSISPAAAATISTSAAPT